VIEASFNQPDPADPAHGGDRSPLHDLPEAVDRLRAGRLVAFPTETVYGLGADATNPEAIARVFAAKGRPSHNPLIVHVSGQRMAEPLVANWPEAAERAIEALWPGPLTIVLPKSAAVPAIATGGGPNVAVRCPDHPVALALLMAVGTPLVGPSANPSGRTSPTTATHVRSHFDPQTVMVLDGGPCSVGIESTVLSLVRPEAPVILRPGMLGAEALSEVLGVHVGVATGVSEAAAGAALASPGMMDRHYAPQARTVMIDEPDEIEEYIETLPGHQRDAVVVISHSVLIEEGAGPWMLVEMPHQPAEYAASLYAALRAADDAEPPLILIHRPPTDGQTPAETAIWRAIADRLRRAVTPG
jgi:L-threonylcarbamoyladenylate synthase